MHRFILLFFFCFVFLSNVLFSQTQITGIVQSTDKSPLPSANVSLHNSTDSSIITGALTDKNGRFSLNVVTGKYYINVRFVGYKSTFINVEVSNKNVNLGTIILTPDEILQSEITVEAEKELVEIGIDSRKYNVTKDMTAGENNILDVLRKIPSVEVDMDDNVKMNGTTPKILVNGRESPMSDKEMLKMLSSDLVESVELITNPSAKYEAEGVSGIIDIQLKKGADQGYNAMIRAGFGSDFELKNRKNGNLGVNANIKTGKMNLFVRANTGIWN
jgi:hypothetical protein